MPPIRRLEGMVFGRLTVIEATEKRERASRAVIWRCRCECGNDTFVAGGNLTSGNIAGCGYHIRKHGAYQTREYQAWENMHQRCGNKNHPQYFRYGGRGICVCERWATFENFIADLGPRPTGLTLERIDGNKGYEPQNCKWATYAEQNRNISRNRWVTLNGVTLCVQDWCKQTGVTQNAVNGRLRKGWSFDRIFTTPVASRSHAAKASWIVRRGKTESTVKREALTTATPATLSGSTSDEKA